MRQAGMACVLIVLAASVSAAQGVKATVLAGAGGYLRSDCITPVMVILENEDRDREGELEVSLEYLGSPVGSAFTRVNLPSTSRKAVFVYVPGSPELVERVRVQYRTTRGQTLLDYTEALNPSAAAVPVIGSIGRVPSSLPPAENPDKSSRYIHLTLTPDQLPDRCDGLLMYDAFILSPAPDTPLSRYQVNALHEWVLRGGVLIVDASRRTDSLMNGMLPELLPFRPQGADQKSFTIFGEDMPYAHGDVSRGEVLIESDGVPLVVRRNVGLGSVVCFAVEPNSPVWRKWEGHADLWPRILAFLNDVSRSDTLPYMRGQEDRKVFLRSLVQTNRRAGLRLGLVILLIALYAVLVGPVDYWLVRKLGAPRLTFITFPAMVAVFTLLSWFGAKAWVGGDMALTARERVLYVPDENALLRFHIAALFVPMIGDYKVEHESGGLVQPLRASFTSPFEFVSPRLDVDSGAITQRIPGWQERVFYSTDTLPVEAGGLSLTVEPDGKAVRVVKSGNHRLVDARILYGEDVWFVDLPSSDTVVSLGAPSQRRPHLSWGGSFQTFTELGRSTDDWGRASEWREFHVEDALSRGALLLIAEDREVKPSGFSVDGSPRPELAQCTVMAITYPVQEGHTVAFGEPDTAEKETP
ncbi:MAG: hypothetical protein IT365_24695 [Candidatus Hydrogenedentes bacterium]|nr:hypothetical protein [Candidatus Hydrogenedentota bacterium]